MNKDRFSKSERSALMAKIRNKDTAPEMAVRRMTHSLGFRYRLHRKDLPGKPDLVFSGKKKVIFVHGCFWHGHDCPLGTNQPKSNIEYWTKKLVSNQNRDKNNIRLLEDMGWNVLIVWECEVKNILLLAQRIISFLNQ